MREHHLKAHDICFWPVGALVAEVRLALQPIAWTDYEYPDMVPYRARLGHSTRPSQSFEQVQRWYHDCVENHKQCKAATPKSGFLPSRLVEILQTCDCGFDLKIRLRSRKDLQDSLPAYASLSHRWGPDMPFKLMTANMEDCMKEIPHDKISKVFQDAIRLAFRLDLRYIWIDSLCIIQDSKADWTFESVKMSEIYNHSVLNIASTGFSDGQKGLYTTRDSELICPIRVVLDQDQHVLFDRENSPALQQREEPKGEYVLCDVNLWKDGIDDAALGKRGWVVQERAASTRTLHFGLEQLFWECCTSQKCEVYPDELLRGTLARRPKIFCAGPEEEQRPRFFAGVDWKPKLKVEPTQERMLKKYRRSHIQSLCEEIKLMRQKHKWVEQGGDEENTHWEEISKMDVGDDYHEYYDNYPSDPTPWPTARSMEDFGITLDFFEGCEEDDIETVERCKIGGWDEFKAKLTERRRNPPQKKEFRPPSIQQFTYAQRKWTAVVEAYSGCALTFSQDKFLAIAGMARRMAPEMQCAYLAGMWRKDLEHQLLWKISPQRAIPNDGTRGPSWSWASRDGGVKIPQWWGGGLIEWFCEVDDVNVKPIEILEGLVEPEYGQLQSGTLTLTGRLGVLRLPKDATDDAGSCVGKLHDEKRHIRTHWDTLETQAIYGVLPTIMAVWKYSIYGDSRDTMDVFYMPFRIMEWDPDGRDYSGPMVTGLLLQPTARKGEYRRVGQFEMSEHWVKGSVRPLVDGTEMLDEQLFVSRGEEGRYTITVV